MVSADMKIMNYLARRDHSEAELRQKLARSYEREEIDAAIERAKESSWWPDPEVLAERTVASLLGRGKGAFYIRQYLSQKGLPPKEVPADVEFQAAIDMIERKFLIEESPEKVMRMLKNRGFRDGTIWKIKSEVLDSSQPE